MLAEGEGERRGRGAVDIFAGRKKSSKKQTRKFSYENFMVTKVLQFYFGKFRSRAQFIRFLAVMEA